MKLSQIISIAISLSYIGVGALACRSRDPSHKVLSTESPESRCRTANAPRGFAIAHRGLSHDAPEETLPAFQLARDIGADFLELDLQRTKDGHLIALHDEDLQRTTDVATVFPSRAKNTVADFTLEELKRLDAGSWFNAKYPERARPGFRGLKIMTLAEVSAIANEKDGPNGPVGLYIETKVPSLFPGIEADLYRELSQLGWLAPKKRALLFLQTFEMPSLEILAKTFPGDVSKTLLLWIGDGYMPALDAQASTVDQGVFEAWVSQGIEKGATAVGPDLKTLMTPAMVAFYKKRNLCIHPYTVDDDKDLGDLDQVQIVDGIFTNRVDHLLDIQQRRARSTVAELLVQAGY